MKITFLGTGASEGIPSMFCTCNVCENARKVGGKEVRSRVGVLINDDLMVDFSSDALLNAVRHGVRYTDVKNVLITHSHEDHLDPLAVVPRQSPRDMAPPKSLNIYANETALSIIEKINSASLRKGLINLKKIELGVTTNIGGYTVTSFRSIHIESEESMVFLIEKGGKSYLHLYDTGRVIDDVFQYLTSNGIKVDCVVLDCTYGLLDREYFGHMNLNQVVDTCKKFRAKKCFTDQTQIYISHICHWSATHEELCAAAAKHGINVAYDGLAIEF